jgi:predicted TIM-barrel fold metal-dependent hydrolase
MEEVPIPDADKDNIFHGNARRIFKIVTPATTTS